MTKYTLGFIFNKPLTKVLLLHKVSPEWQKGRVNGIGGKTEKGETSLACIIRETKEESDLDVTDWTFLGNMHGADWTMDVFAAVYAGRLTDARKADKEEVEWFSTKRLPANIWHNVHWLIYFALDRLTNESLKEFSIRYK